MKKNIRNSITRRHKAAFVLLYDSSLSMNSEVICDGVTTTKAILVAALINDMLSELIERARRSDGIRDYYDIAAVRYSGDGVESTLTDDDDDIFIPVTQLEERRTLSYTRRVTRTLPSGEEVMHDLEQKRWVEPLAKGKTPLHEAITHIYEPLAKWCASPGNRDSIPPMVFIISDGGSTDCDTTDIMRACDELRTLGTNNGSAIVMNIHIAFDSDISERIIFPRSDMDLSGRDVKFRTSFGAASNMPSEYNDLICSIYGHEPLPEQATTTAAATTASTTAATSSGRSSDGVAFKAMGYNVPFSQVLTLFNIGSISVKRG